MFTLAHISDPHLGPLPEVDLKSLMGKRALGYLSWQRRRRRIHRPEVLSALEADLTAQAPHHVAVTGDLTNISLPAEFEQTARWLGRLGPAEDVSVVPGNHDAYVALPWAESWHHWSPFMTCEGSPESLRVLQDFDHFPYLRRRGPIALIGLSSAHPTPPFMAGGSLGSEQLKRLHDLLERLGADGCCRILLIHHPPKRRKRGRKSLWDSDALIDCVEAGGAELILHGHQHSFHNSELKTAHGPAQVLGVPSASAHAAGHKPQSHYQIYGIERHDDGWHVEISVRAYAADNERFEPARTHHLLLERPSLESASRPVAHR